MNSPGARAPTNPQRHYRLGDEWLERAKRLVAVDQRPTISFYVDGVAKTLLTNGRSLSQIFSLATICFRCKYIDKID